LNDREYRLIAKFYDKNERCNRKEISEPQTNTNPEQKAKQMQVKVHYISLVKSYTNKSQDEFNLPDGTPLSGLLDKIAQAYGSQFSKEVYDPTKKEMKATFVAMVNGVLMDQLKGVDTHLKDGDSVILMSLVTGG
jgi:molybdopterin converting factor small subunit